MKAKPLSRVQLAETPGTAAPGSSVHGIFQTKVLEWGATAFSERAYSVAEQDTALCLPVLSLVAITGYN